MEAEVADQDVQVGATIIRLSKILVVDSDGPDGSAKAIVGDKTITGKLLGLEKVATTLGGATTTLDLSKAKCFTVKPIDRSLAGVHYRITVNVNGVSMEDSDGTVPIETAESLAAAGAPATRPSQPADVSPRPQRQPPGGDASLPGIAVKTEQLGGHGGSEFIAIQPAVGSFLGFRYTTAQWLGKQIMGKVEPIFQRPPPDTPGLNPPPVTIMARDGYVVGGMVVDPDDAAIVAFKVVFVRYKDGRISPADTYQSDWCGTPGGRPTRQLAGHGETVIGVFGRQGRNLDAMGLVTQTPISQKEPGGDVAR